MARFNLGHVWSSLLALVRSLLTFLSSPLTTTTTTTVARLRPLRLTQRSIVHNDDDDDAELALPDVPPPAPSATSLRQGTPDTSHTGSLYVLPLTPPDRCYLAPLPSTTDCPYTEPWPADVPLDRGNSRLLPGSPLKPLVDTAPAFPEPMVAPIGSPPPGRWSPVQIWSSTPHKNDDDSLVHDPALASSSFDRHNNSSSALVNVSHALIARSQSSIRPYDASNSSTSSDASPLVDPNAPQAGRERHRAQTHLPLNKNQPYPRFHQPDAYAYTWRRHGARLPGRLPAKPCRTHAYARSHSHMDLPISGWYDTDAYAPSPIPVLSPPLAESEITDVEDEDEMPLGRLRERLARRNAAIGANIALDLPVDTGTRTPVALSPRTRRMSEGCLLAISESTPTRVGVGVRSRHHVRSLALDGDGCSVRDWLEALSLHLPSEQEEALAPKPGLSCIAASPVNALV